MGVTNEGKVLAFIGNSFRSVWALEVLRFLVERRDETHDAAELIAELRASNSVISQSIATLEAAALITLDEGGNIRFQPASDELDHLAQEAVALYERRPGQVRRIIVSHTSPSITAFADAFKLRKD